MLPLISFRVVTRGDFPELVRRNVERNIRTCKDAGLKHFIFEVVTDKSISLPCSEIQKEVVVPKDYVPKSGCMYKARALQYCLDFQVRLFFFQIYTKSTPTPVKASALLDA